MKTLVITGASSGIGLETAKVFQNEDYSIVNLSRKKIPLDGSTHLETDLSDSKALEINLHKAVNLVKDSDQICLVHNASNMASDNVEEIDADQMRGVFEVNLVAPAILNRALLPLMNAGSSIIYIGSTLSEKAVPHMASYVTSKHAMVGLMRSTCQDLFGKFVHTVCVCPGATRTEMLMKYVGGDESALKLMAKTLSEQRLIEPVEIARTILFCAQNSVVNGSVIHANLGILET
ncbi:uncharacterized protein METZ01_LOCUS147513 [marine metagenome]|uniref:Short-chain dehydrogenase n=1 Tax=marine metagenome TaxID=408172 RepID=A0A381ZZT9_9ZZZZ